MTKKNDSLALLPNGFADLLPPYAEGEARCIESLMSQFSSFGYRRIKPPLLEFEDSLLAPGPGERLANETFRVMDPVSHRMMGIRSDVTAQVSRIVSSRLINALRPLRLMYASDVLRTRGSQMRTERQFSQVGCELISDDNDVQTDIEICVLSVLGLKSVGINNITLDMTIPGFVSSLMYGVGEENRDVIEKAVEQRDVDSLQSLGLDIANNIAKALNSSGKEDHAFAVLDGVSVSEDVANSLSRLKDISSGVNDALADLGVDDVSITIDVLEQGGFEYHEGFGFTLFSSDARGELGRGGNYKIHFGHNENVEMAKGFTLYMDTILQLSASDVEKDTVFVNSAEKWSVILDLQSQGWAIIRGNGDVHPSCSHVYENGVVSKLVK